MTDTSLPITLITLRAKEPSITYSLHSVVISEPLLLSDYVLGLRDENTNDIQERDKIQKERR